MDEKSIQIGKKEKKLDWHKVFAPIGAALIVVILFASAVWIYVENQGTTITLEDESSVKIATSSAKVATTSAKKDETLDWKTYTNTEVNFSVRYPKDWKIKESSVDNICTTDQAFFASEDALLGKCASGFGGIIGINRTAVGTDITMVSNNYIDNDYQNLKKENLTISGKKAIKVSGISKVKNEVVDFTDAKEVHYLIDLGTRVLSLDYRQLKDWKDYSKEFELMVSTFKFL